MSTVYFRHIREARICASGARAWFAQKGFSWADFLINGIPAQTLDDTGDPFAFQVTAIARADIQPLD